HSVATQGHGATNRHPLAQLEAGNRLPSACNHRLLTGNGAQLGHRRVNQLGVGHRVTETHIDDDLFDLRGLHHVLVAELFLELGPYGLLVEVEHAGLGYCITHDCLAYSSALGALRTLPLFAATRTFFPSRSSKRTRVGLP